MPSTKRSTPDDATPIPVKTMRKYEVVSGDRRTLRIYSEEGVMEFGQVNPKSGILFAKYEGKTYVAYKYRNPSLVDETGDCVQRHAVGVTLESLLSIYSHPETPVRGGGSPIEGWNAWFALLSPVKDSTLSIRVILNSPFANNPTCSFQDELEFHEFFQ
jgi:hypothetical protein